jgi:hypothetical protein
LPKFAENHPALRKKEQNEGIKGTKNTTRDVWKGLFHAAGEKSVKKYQKCLFDNQKT